MKMLLSLTIAACLLSTYCYSQLNPVLNVGNVTKVTVKGQQLDITTEKAYVQVSVFTPSIIRVRMDKAPLGRDFSYAVVGKPVVTKVGTSDMPEQVIIMTDSLSAIIRNSIRFLYT